MRDDGIVLLQDLAEYISDKRVLEAMRHVPREAFVPDAQRRLAYADVALSIGFDQTISQPFMVALMTQEAELKPTDKVLEVGTGSGYQAAVLAEMVKTVVTVERIPELTERARLTLDDLGYRNVHVHQAVRGLGWEPDAPYDAILVTAASPRVPMTLFDQLKEGGRLIVPVGTREEQELVQVKKTNGEAEVLPRGACRFVPLVGEGAWPETAT